MLTNQPSLLPWPGGSSDQLSSFNVTVSLGFCYQVSNRGENYAYSSSSNKPTLALLMAGFPTSRGLPSYSFTRLCHSWTLWGFWRSRTLLRSKGRRVISCSKRARRSSRSTSSISPTEKKTSKDQAGYKGNRTSPLLYYLYYLYIPGIIYLCSKGGDPSGRKGIKDRSAHSQFHFINFSLFPPGLSHPEGFPSQSMDQGKKAKALPHKWYLTPRFRETSTDPRVSNKKKTPSALTQSGQTSSMQSHHYLPLHAPSQTLSPS